MQSNVTTMGLTAKLNSCVSLPLNFTCVDYFVYYLRFCHIEKHFVHKHVAHCILVFPVIPNLHQI